MQKSLVTFFAVAGLILPFVATQTNAAPVSKIKRVRHNSKRETATLVSEGRQKAEGAAGQTVQLYSCELGNRFTVYRDRDDDSYIDLKWNNKKYRMSHVETSTGAERYEDKRDGLVWVNIPAKSMLLDLKKGKQLANECRNAEQRRAQLAFN